MTPCPLCHRSDSRLPVVVTVLAVLVALSWGGIGLCLWDIRNLRDEISRMPQAAVLSIPGHYPTVTVYREGFVIKEGVAEDPLRKPEKKK